MALLDLAHFSFRSMIDFDFYKKNIEMMRNAVLALSTHAKNGFQNATEPTYNLRKTICSACEFWDAEGWGGLGKCEKCGCSGIKLKLASSTCPLGHWGEERIDTP
jgi:hypothetical protein